MRGDGRLYEVSTGERFQTQTDENGRFYQTKNAHWEQLWADNQFVYRDIDTSPGGGRFYRLKDSDLAQGSRWCPRHMAVGDIYLRTPLVSWYNAADCVVTEESQSDTYITLVAHHDSITFASGVTVHDVVELEWSAGETYYYGRGFGLVAWGRSHYDPYTPQVSYITEIHAAGQRPDNKREVIGCLGV